MALKHRITHIDQKQIEIASLIPKKPNTHHPPQRATASMVQVARKITTACPLSEAKRFTIK
jgi:hypothetical protein